MMGVMISSTTHATSKEGYKTGSVCYRILQDLRKSSHIYNQEKLEHLLSKFAKMASTTYPKFTAAGFMAVDYTWFYTIINMSVTYLIVIFQLED